MSAAHCTILLATVLAGSALAQDTSTFPIADDEIAMTFTKVSQRAGRIEPMLQQVKPGDWVSKGAPETYSTQWNSILTQYRAVKTDMTALAQHPGNITDTMKALFRLQAIHPLMDSLMGGTRKYQNPALADLIESVAAENTADMDKVQRYLVQIASDREQEFTIVDHEAQRCRSVLSKQPASPSSGRNNNRKTQ